MGRAADELTELLLLVISQELLTAHSASCQLSCRAAAAAGNICS
jgi:type II secretory ATPase GspE/PulE/Tfp pilus assembly ATPase PilB-like protein